MKKKRISAEEIVEIHALHKRGFTAGQIAEKTGIAMGSAWFCFTNINNYLTGKRMVKSSTPETYLKALKIIKNQANEKETQESKPAPVSNVYAQLQEAIANVVVAEVEALTQTRIAEKERELAEQKEKYEQELLRLQAIITEARDSSLMDVIKRKMTQLA